jgi:hypothetical protein
MRLKCVGETNDLAYLTKGVGDTEKSVVALAPAWPSAWGSHGSWSHCPAASQILRKRKNIVKNFTKLSVFILNLRGPGCVFMILQFLRNLATGPIS